MAEVRSLQQISSEIFQGESVSIAFYRVRRGAASEELVQLAKAAPIENRVGRLFVPDIFIVRLGKGRLEGELGLWFSYVMGVLVDSRDCVDRFFYAGGRT